MNTVAMEWRHTYHSARGDGHRRRAAARKFVREVLAGWRLTLGLHPKYDCHGRTR